MKKRKNKTLELAVQMALTGALALTNKLIENNPPAINRKLKPEQLNRRLAWVQTAYHLLGIFYND